MSYFGFAIHQELEILELVSRFFGYWICFKIRMLFGPGKDAHFLATGLDSSVSFFLFLFCEVTQHF
uniref:Uncharacterized protein n=1 Tax=Oryza brachyantha TaxID=4533 RepID=J3MBZ6_ORYBR